MFYALKKLPLHYIKRLPTKFPRLVSDQEFFHPLKNLRYQLVCVHDIIILK